MVHGVDTLKVKPRTAVASGRTPTRFPPYPAYTYSPNNPATLWRTNGLTLCGLARGAPEPCPWPERRAAPRGAASPWPAHDARIHAGSHTHRDTDTKDIPPTSPSEPPNAHGQLPPTETLPARRRLDTHHRCLIEAHMQEVLCAHQPTAIDPATLQPPGGLPV